MIMDISYMYFNMPLKDFQYIRFHIDLMPEEVTNENNLRDKVDKVDKDGWIYCEIRKAIYGLNSFKESGKLANVQLQKSSGKTRLLSMCFHTGPIQA